jgi:hypothetical protein
MTFTKIFKSAMPIFAAQKIYGNESVKFGIISDIHLKLDYNS